MSWDPNAAQAAYAALSTEDEYYPPHYLAAALLSVVESPADATAYSTSEYVRDSGHASWSAVVLDGNSLVLIKAIGPTLDQSAGQYSPIQEPTELHVSVHPFSHLTSVSVALRDLAHERFGDRGLTWRRVWTVRFADGDEFTMPADNELSRQPRRDQADQLAAALLARCAPAVHCRRPWPKDLCDDHLRASRPVLHRR